MLRCLAVAILSFSLSSLAISQTTSDPQALTLAAQAITALTGGTPVADATVQVSATDAFSGRTGTAVMQAKGYDESRIQLQASNRVDIRGLDQLGDPGAAWVAANGTTYRAAQQNAFGDASWFFPALSSGLNNAAQPGFLASYIGQETRNGISVQHLRFQRISTLGNTSLAALQTRLSTVDVWLDASSYLPVGEAFKVHPENDALTDIGIEIHFSNYQVVNGIEVPFHVQRFLNGGPMLDLTVSTVSLNTGLPDSLFTLPNGQ